MEENTMRVFNPSNFGDEKLDKSTELNSEMSMSPQVPDEFTTAVKTKSS